MHHDLKPDNIMYRLVNGKRIWYLIDFGFAWYGGKHYNLPGMAPGPQNCPYGFIPDYINGSGVFSDGYKKAGWPYNGWPLEVPPVPTPYWDLLSLTYWVWKWRSPIEFPQEESRHTSRMPDGSNFGFQHRLLQHCLATKHINVYDPDYKPTPRHHTDTNRQWLVTLPDGHTVMLFPSLESSVEDAH
jgi:serine/threonine protein kinase